MIDRLIEQALRNRLLVLLFVAAAAGLGYASLRQVPVDSFPDVSPALVQVFTVSPGLSPVDVETQISYPIEIGMYGLPGLERVQSTSIFGLSRVDAYFEDGTDIFFARRLVLERLASAREEIPEGLGSPELGPITTGLGTVMMYVVRNVDGAGHSPMELRTAQDWIVKPMLRTVPGITEVLSIGGFVRQYQVRADINALLARGLTLTDLREALTADNRNVGASFLERGGEEYLIRGHGRFGTGDAGLEDIRNVIVATHEGIPIYVRDVAEVASGHEIRRGLLVSEEREAVGGYVLKLIYTNTRDLLERIDVRVEAVNRALPAGMEVFPYYTQGMLVDKAVGTVESALLEGSILVLVFLFLFLGDVRSTLIVISVLPLSALAAFIGMKLTGQSANLMSLGGLAIGIGMMVDGAVVVVENIFRYVEEKRGEPLSMTRLVSEATREVGRPVVFAISIIVIVFLPLFTLQGVEGKLFAPMAYTIAFAVIGALVLALTYVPVVSSLVIRAKAPGHAEPWLVRKLRAGYQPLLHAALARPKRVMMAAVIGLLISLALFPFLGSEFVPTLREGTLLVRATLPPGANLTTTGEYAARMERVIRTYPQVTGVYSRAGRAEVGGDPEPVNTIESVVNLLPLEEWKGKLNYEELQSDMADRVSDAVPGLALNFSQPIQLRTDELMSGVRAEVVVSLYGEDLDVLAEMAEEIKGIAEQIPGAADVRALQQSGKPQIVVRPDRKALSRYGVSVNAFLEVVETGIGGSVVGQVYEGIRRFDVFVRLKEEQRTQIEQIRRLPIRTADGAVIPLSQVADVEVLIGPKEVSRNLASRRTYVQLNVRGRDMGSVVEDIQLKVEAELDFPPGYFIEYGGQFENQERAMRRLFIVVPVTLALIFFMLFSAYGSLRYAALIFLNVPFAAIGGIVALFVSGMYLSVPAAVGFIAVFGIAVLNGVVLVSYINQLRERGMEMMEAVITGSEHRLRPVMMTASVAVLGLIPLLLSNDIGSEVQRPLAAVVVGGVLTSTLLTLVVLPSVYRWFAGEAVEEIQM